MVSFVDVLVPLCARAQIYDLESPFCTRREYREYHKRTVRLNDDFFLKRNLQTTLTMLLKFIGLRFRVRAPVVLIAPPIRI